MTINQLESLLPLMILALATVVVMLAIAVRRDHRLTVALTLLGLLVAFVTLLVAGPSATGAVTPLLTLDAFARFFIGLDLITSFAVAMLSYRYLELHAENRDELYILLLLATLGSAVLVAASHFASFFLGLEILSVSLYALLGYQRSRAGSVEAAVKYLILAATSGAFLLFGLALVYADSGTMEFARLATLQPTARSPLLLVGMGMAVIGIGYKLGVVPFHLWTPDVYEGAPAPVVAFIATVSKASMFALLLRLFTHVGLTSTAPLFVVFVAIAIASMLAGNLLGMLQANVKRVLAYSSIAHMGYLLVAFLAGGALGIAAATFYLVTYVAATLGAFAVITVVSDAGRDADSLEDYRGLFWQHPWLATAFTIALLSLAGIPLTGGFIGKFYLVDAGIGASLWALVVILVLSSVVGLFYYLRVAIPMFSQPAGGTQRKIPVPASSGGASWVLAAVAIIVVVLGVFPSPVLQIVQAAVAGLA